MNTEEATSGANSAVPGERWDFIRLRSALGATHSGLLTLKARGETAAEVVDSRRMEPVTGHPDAVFTGDPRFWISLVADADRAGVEERVNTALRGEPAGPIERRIRHADGSFRWIRFQFCGHPGPSLESNLCDVVLTDITALREAQNSRRKAIQRLCRMVTLDMLTGLYNRRGLQDALPRIWNMGRRSQTPTGALALDIDFFKAVNDTYGHDAGDQVLVESAALIRDELRAEDVVCRTGGDEIVALLPLAEPDETRAVAERLLNAFRRHAFLNGSRKIDVRVSIGAACGSAHEYSDPRRLIEAADAALYRAKKTGRDRLCFGFVSESAPPDVRPVPGAPDDPPAAADSRHRITVLVVDDEASQQRLMARMLKVLGCEALTASDGESALARLRGGASVDLALVDLHLVPPESGLDVLERLTAFDGTLVGAIVTGQASLPAALDALRHGAYDFLQKPFSMDDMHALVDRAMKVRNLLLQRRHYQLHLEEMARRKTEALERALDQVESSYQSTLETLAALIDAREKQTGAHSERVKRITGILARRLGVPEEQRNAMIEGALLHDIGKVAVPDAVLLKPGPLSDEEWAVMRTHPAIGYNLLRTNALLDKVADIVHQHQERYDGSGYPQGLKGDEICRGARIFAIADTYDAIRSDRPYSRGRGAAEALAEIQRHRGRLFDPQVVDILATAQPEIEATCNWKTGG